MPLSDGQLVNLNAGSSLSLYVYPVIRFIVMSLLLTVVLNLLIRWWTNRRQGHNQKDRVHLRYVKYDPNRDV